VSPLLLHQLKRSPDDSSNFADTFLAYCASGFIGTLARVNIQTASLTAKKILLSALRPGGVQIAEKLRQLRQNEMTHLEELKQSESASRDDYYRVIDTFMYVYYGNSLVYLQLHEKKDIGAWSSKKVPRDAPRAGSQERKDTRLRRPFALPSQLTTIISSSTLLSS
jgi:hypothetical protein